MISIVLQDLEADDIVIRQVFEAIRVDFDPQVIVTEHPTESGSAVSDHVQIRAERFSVAAWVTDSPLGEIPVLGAVQAARSYLESAAGRLLRVTIDGEGVYRDVVLESWSHSRTAVEGRRFDLRFRQIRIAQGLSVEIPPRQPAPAARVGAPSEQGLGQQSATSGEPPTSVLQATLDAGRSLSSYFFGGG